MATVLFMKLPHGLALALVASFAMAAVACGDGQPAEPEGAPAQASASTSPGPAGPAKTSGNGDAPPRPSLTEQGVAGQTLFKAHCAQCHGTSVSVSAFDTAADLVAYIGANMPQNAPGSLTQSEYLSIAAFDLVANGIDLKGETLDAANAGSVSVR